MSNSVLLAMLLGVVGCGSSSMVAAGQFQDLCVSACQPPANTPCAGEDPMPCITACVTATNGLTPTCAQCITKNSGFWGYSCATGCPCHFGVGSAGCPPSCLGYTCKSSDNQCEGFVIEKATDQTCNPSCS